MKPPRRALFVQRRTYRRRRMGDAARLLPVIGGILFMLPLLWTGGAAAGRTAWVMSYVFFVWAGLALLSGVLSRYLETEDDAGGSDIDAPAGPDDRADGAG